MGADLYISSLYTQADDSPGYFRDSYNNSSLMWQLGLSWWSDLGDKYINKHGLLRPRKAQKLVFEVKSRRNTLETNMDLLLKGYNPHFDFEITDWKTKTRVHKRADLTDKERQGWVDYFYKKYDNFITFLETAIKLKEPIECST